MVKTPTTCFKNGVEKTGLQVRKIGVQSETLYIMAEE